MPDTVRETFDQLRQLLKWDINHMREFQEGGNYAIALLVAIGCEAIGLPLGRHDDTTFIEIMSKHRVSREMAADVFSALRHGIAHTYDTRYIQAGDLKVELIVSRGGLNHTSVRRTPPGLVLNVETMWQDLQEVFERLRQNLPAGGQLPAQWIKDSVKRADDRAVEGWQKWIANAEEARPK
jgi:hypothetical protein